MTLQLCGSSSWIIPLGLAMPYLWRLFQCIRVYRDTGNQGQVGCRSSVSCLILPCTCMASPCPGTFQVASSYQACLRKTAIDRLQSCDSFQLGSPRLAQSRADRLTKFFLSRMQLFNALKYSTAFPVIIFSAMKYQVSHEAWAGLYKPLWLGAALLNSSYSYFWDVERDWEIQFFTSPGVHNAYPPEKLQCMCKSYGITTS